MRLPVPTIPGKPKYDPGRPYNELPLLPPPFDVLAINLSLIGHFKPMVQGSVFVSDICYFVSLSLLVLFLTTRRLAER